MAAAAYLLPLLAALAVPPVEAVEQQRHQARAAAPARAPAQLGAAQQASKLKQARLQQTSDAAQGPPATPAQRKTAPSGRRACLRQPDTRLSLQRLEGASARLSVSSDSTAAPVPQHMAPSSGGTAGGAQRASASAAAPHEASWCSRRSREPLRSSAAAGGGRGGSGSRVGGVETGWRSSAGAKPAWPCGTQQKPALKQKQNSRSWRKEPPAGRGSASRVPRPRSPAHLAAAARPPGAPR